MINSIGLFTTSSMTSSLTNLRVAGPASHLNIKVIFGGENFDLNVILDKINRSDLVIIQRDFPRMKAAFHHVVTKAREQHKPIVFELDDNLFELPSEHPDRQNGYYSEALVPMIRAVVDADLVITSSDKITSRLVTFNSNTITIPNYFMDNIWHFRTPSIRRSAENSVIIGYMGGPSHTPDIEMLQPVFLELLKRFPNKITFRFWGIKPPEDLISHNCVEYDADVEYDYGKFAKIFQEQECDIFLAPLINNYFNSCKSSVKYFEYTSLGIPGVYSKILPYEQVVTNGENGFLAETIEDWIKYTGLLIENPVLGQKMASNAQKHIKASYLLSNNAHLWQSAYEKAQLISESMRGEEQRNRSQLMRTIDDQVSALYQSAHLDLERIEIKVNDIYSLIDKITEGDFSNIQRQEEIVTGESLRSELFNKLNQIYAFIELSESHIDQLTLKIAEKDKQLEVSQDVNQETEAKFMRFSSSRTYRIAVSLEKWIRKLIPRDSVREKIVKRILK